MQNVAAALTMVRGDAFFLGAWLRHYGTLLGRENCYIVNHGRGADVARAAEGCNLIGIPGEPDAAFDVKRWRLLNHVVQGLRGYYAHVVVGDVDELVVRDPATGEGLLDLLARTPPRRNLTALGLEILHRTDLETAPIETAIIGPRRHVRLAPHYSKPCIIGHGGKIARGGHFTQCETLHCPEGLYLMHLKYCDFGVYSAVMDQRNAMAEAFGRPPKEVAMGRHWFSAARGEDRARFERFGELQMQEGFDLDWVREAMFQSWQPRGETGFWQFDRPDYPYQYVLPDRFVGVI